MLLPLDLAIDVWLLREPPWEPPVEAAGGQGADPATLASPECSGSPAGVPDPIFKSYHLVVSYSWRCEKGAFSMPWHSNLSLETHPDDHEKVERLQADARRRSLEASARRAHDAD